MFSPHTSEFNTGGLKRLSGQAVRYFVVSLLALGCDLAIFAAMIATGISAVVAGITGYLTGVIFHYCLSSYWVFPAAADRRTWPTFAKFVASGLIGTAVTAGIIGAVTESGIAGPFIAKTVAVAVSFALLFLIRRAYVFGHT